MKSTQATAKLFGIQENFFCFFSFVLFPFLFWQGKDIRLEEVKETSFLKLTNGRWPSSRRFGKQGKAKL